MKTSNELNLRTGNDTDRESQLYHKHTFGSVGNNMNSPTNVGPYGNKKAPLPSIEHLSYSPGSQQTTTIIPQQQPLQPPRHLKTSILSTAISSLTYGLSCLIYESQTNLIYECLMMIHQEYINILHVIINRNISYLLKLNDVKSIMDQDTFVASKLNALDIQKEFKQNYIVLNLKSLKTLVFVFRTEHQKYAINMGLKFFLNQGRLFYSKLSQYDPFKAQSMMLFLQADKDGGNLLDIEQIISILQQLKINKQKIDIQTDVLEINKSLYERQNMKRPKNASPQQLTPIAFQYLLRYYSIKQQLLKFFKEYCPMFKPKNKNHKNTIIDIIKNNQKPIMSSFQLKQFYREILKQQDKSEQQFDEIIKKFPVYDGQGKQKFDVNEDEMLLSFDNFCNLICSKQNCLLLNIQQSQYSNKLQELNRNDSEDYGKKNAQKHYLSYSLLNYHIYTDQSMKNPKRKQKSNFFTLALKRGVKCLNLKLNLSMLNNNARPTESAQNNKNVNQSQQKLSALVVRIDQKQKQEQILDDILKDVKIYAFDKNELPFFIVLDIDSLFKEPNYFQYLELLNQVIEDSLDKESVFVFTGNKEQKKTLLPTPLQLQGKIIFMTTLNPKLLQKSLSLKKQIQIPKSLTRKVTFNGVKLDFQRKGQNYWNCCFIDLSDLKNYQSAEQENICNYSKKIMLFGVRKDMNLVGDSFSCFRQGIHFTGENFERNKEINYILHSKFAQLPDEYFGYKLKPNYMHTENPAPLYSNKNFTKQLQTRIKFNVLSGQKLILNNFLFKQFHVEVSVKGNVSDEQNNKTYKSTKKTQGFYTEINLQCEFVVYNEELFTIFVVVRDSQSSRILSARGVSLKKMRQGLRSLQLFNERMQTKENSYLLIHYTRKQIAQRDDKASKMHQFLK